MKPILALVAAVVPIFSTLPANSQPYTYTAECWYKGRQTNFIPKKVVCEITDIRDEKNQSLEERDVMAYSPDEKIHYALRSWTDSKGLKTWDNDCQCEYITHYQILSPNQPYTKVTDRLWVPEISWD